MNPFCRLVCAAVAAGLLLAGGSLISAQPTNLPAHKPATNAPPLTKAAQIKIFTNQLNWAIEKVQKLVNQPVSPVAYDSAMGNVGWYPYWFHDGANTPDFDTVDVRTTQEFPYAAFAYVGSDLDRSLVFPAAQLEFNANTKYFYTDRSVPKKKLTPAEMVEINRLYRIIGNDQRQLARLRAQP